MTTDLSKRLRDEALGRRLANNALRGLLSEAADALESAEKRAQEAEADYEAEKKAHECDAMLRDEYSRQLLAAEARVREAEAALQEHGHDRCIPISTAPLPPPKMSLEEEDES